MLDLLPDAVRGGPSHGTPSPSQRRPYPPTARLSSPCVHPGDTDGSRPGATAIEPSLDKHLTNLRGQVHSGITGSTPTPTHQEEPHEEDRRPCHRHRPRPHRPGGARRQRRPRGQARHRLHAGRDRHPQGGGPVLHRGQGGLAHRGGRLRGRHRP
ncbi:hypothetical protein [Ornithinimicrobium kibberense]|uniref:hypothetical protein n=1 Tax=Ornithinimicrobium kibberense TaxID=282060 RepID=UPI00361E00E1